MEMMRTRIFKCYSESTEEERAFRWYPGAFSFCNSLAEKNKSSIIITSGICAAFSPMKSWSENQRLTECYFNGVYGHMRVQIEKAKRIEQANHYAKTINILGGMKTQNFFRCIFDPSDKNAICIDRHAISLAVGYPKYTCTDREYKLIASAYQDVARDLNIIGSEVQSITWLAYKRIKKNNNGNKI